MFFQAVGSKGAEHDGGRAINAAYSPEHVVEMCSEVKGERKCGCRINRLEEFDDADRCEALNACQFDTVLPVFAMFAAF